VIFKEIYNSVNDISELNNDLETINSSSNQMITCNAEKTNYLIFSEKPKHVPILPYPE
jgi:hypothetical protein